MKHNCIYILMDRRRHLSREEKPTLTEEVRKVNNRNITISKKKKIDVANSIINKIMTIKTHVAKYR